MAILYDWYENPGLAREGEERGLHPRIVMNGKVKTEDLCRMAQERSSLTAGDMKNAVEMLAQICSAELRELREVHIEGLGYFMPVLGTTERVTRSTKNKSAKMELKTIGFRPDALLRKKLAGVQVRQTQQGNHSGRLSEVEINKRLEVYFSNHDLLLRPDFQQLCGLTLSTANRHLRRLVAEGKLRNVGRRLHPLYVPVAGYYGRTDDAELRGRI